MKKILLAGLACSSLIFAQSHNYEITPMFAIGDEKDASTDDTYNNAGLSIARNYDSAYLDQVELGFLRSVSIDYKNSTEETAINRTFINVIKNYPLSTNTNLYALAGFGYQDFTNPKEVEDSPFGNYGLGIKYLPENSSFGLKFDVRHLITTEYGDDSVLYTLGLAIPFGKKHKEVKEVEEKIVMEKDSDKDGIVDSKDSCPNSPSGVSVNEKGCEIDWDSDGIVDSKDSCPNSPTGAKVDEKGCEVDSDKDGVKDSMDKCPNTKAGLNVNEQGCVEKIKLKINFDSNSSAIRQEDKKELNDLIDFLKSYPNKNIAIEAHTDSRGSAQYNLNLSSKRAQAAKQYLINGGIDSSRVEAKGYGETQAIASNETSQGREENRRITVIFK